MPVGGFLEIHQRRLHNEWLPWLVGAVLCLRNRPGRVTAPGWHLRGRKVGRVVWHVWSKRAGAAPRKNRLLLRLLLGAWFLMNAGHEPYDVNIDPFIAQVNDHKLRSGCKYLGISWLHSCGKVILVPGDDCVEPEFHISCCLVFLNLELSYDSHHFGMCPLPWTDTLGAQPQAIALSLSLLLTRMLSLQKLLHHSYKPSLLRL